MEAGTMQQRSWGRALVALRAFLGVVYLSNGAAKLFSFSGFSIGPWRQFLIDRNGARSILASNVHNPDFGVGIARDVANNLILPNWSWIQWLITLGEVAVGLGLLLGILGRLAALGGFLMAFPLFIFALGAGGWTYDYLFEPVLLGILMLTPNLPGLDGVLLSRMRHRSAAPAVTGVSATHAETPASSPVSGSA